MLASRIAIQRIIGSYSNISNISSTHQIHQIHHPIKRMMNTNSNTDSNYTNKKDQKEYTTERLAIIGLFTYFIISTISGTIESIEHKKIMAEVLIQTAKLKISNTTNEINELETKSDDVNEISETE